MKKRPYILGMVPTIVCIVVIIGIFLSISNNRGVSDRDKLVDDVLSYLRDPKNLPDTSQGKIDEDGRVIEWTMGPEDQERLIYYINNAQSVNYVSSIPDLDCPTFSYGDRITGNNQNIYYLYPNSKKILQIEVNDTDSYDLLLYITQFGTPYQEVREYYTEKMKQYLRDQFIPADSDEIGPYFSVEIKTEATLNQLLYCIGNCSNIVDITNVDMPELDFPVIYINGSLIGNYSECEYRDTVTGHNIVFYFQSEDYMSFHNYLINLCQNTGN